MESRMLRVWANDSELVGDFQAVSYTVFADGGMDINLNDGARKHFGWDEWIDLKWHVSLADDGDETAT